MELYIYIFKMNFIFDILVFLLFYSLIFLFPFLAETLEPFGWLVDASFLLQNSLLPRTPLL